MGRAIPLLEVQLYWGLRTVQHPLPPGSEVLPQNPLAVVKIAQGSVLNSAFFSFESVPRNDPLLCWRWAIYECKIQFSFKLSIRKIMKSIGALRTMSVPFPDVCNAPTNKQALSMCLILKSGNLRSCIQKSSRWIAMAWFWWILPFKLNFVFAKLFILKSDLHIHQ